MCEPACCLFTVGALLCLMALLFVLAAVDSTAQALFDKGPEVHPPGGERNVGTLLLDLLSHLGGGSPIVMLLLIGAAFYVMWRSYRREEPSYGAVPGAVPVGIPVVQGMMPPNAPRAPPSGVATGGSNGLVTSGARQNRFFGRDEPIPVQATVLNVAPSGENIPAVQAVPVQAVPVAQSVPLLGNAAQALRGLPWPSWGTK